LPLPFASAFERHILPPAARCDVSCRYGDWSKVARNYVTTAFFFYSPNFVWFLVAAAMYVIFPYNFEAAKTFQWDWCFQR